MPGTRLIYNPHPVLMPIGEAAKRFAGRVAFVYPTRYQGTPGGNLPRRLLRTLRRVFEYELLAISIWRARYSKVIIVREFSTYYIWLTALACLPLMRKTALIVAHNVQRAQSSRLQRRLLILLARLGARLVCLEDTSACLRILPVSLHPSVVQMPSPVGAAGRAAPARQSPAPGEPLLVGFVGDFRPEKGLREVVQTLSSLDLAPDTVRVFVGTPHMEWTTSDLSGLGEAARFFDTTSRAGYVKFLSTVHVLVIPYPAVSYRYRPSGIISDACACGTPVLANDLPVFRTQVTTPAQGGVCVSEQCFASGDCLLAALSQIRSRWLELSAGMAANADARSVDALASTISRLLLHEDDPAQAAQNRR